LCTDVKIQLERSHGVHVKSLSPEKIYSWIWNTLFCVSQINCSFIDIIEFVYLARLIDLLGVPCHVFNLIRIYRWILWRHRCWSGWSNKDATSTSWLLPQGINRHPLLSAPNGGKCPHEIGWGGDSDTCLCWRTTHCVVCMLNGPFWKVAAIQNKRLEPRFFSPIAKHGHVT
jgi:hypothetical protein